MASTPVLVAQGLPDDLDFSVIDGLFQPGDQAELQILIRTGLTTTERSRVFQDITKLESDLRDQGATPWPGELTITSVDFNAGVVHFRFIQNPFFLALLGVLLRLAALVGITSFRTLGVLVRGLLLLAPSLIPTGLFLFTLLRPDLAFKALKYLIEAAAKILGLTVGELLAVIGGTVAGVTLVSNGIGKILR